MKNIADEIERQRQYYAETAREYDAMHVVEGDEHFFALAFLMASVEYLDAKLILDIGSGTGRAIRYIKRHRPELRVVGIEPVKELRDVGYSYGLSQEDLISGDATELQFKQSEFDLVCEFGVLHHIRKPEFAISEMLRVANKAFFISDSNNFGRGSLIGRSIKQMVNSCGLWWLANRFLTRGKGYTSSTGDGIAYSYSVYNSLGTIRPRCREVHILNTKGGAENPYRTASHVALLGIKK